VSKTKPDLDVMDAGDKGQDNAIASDERRKRQKEKAREAAEGRNADGALQRSKQRMLKDATGGDDAREEGKL